MLQSNFLKSLLKVAVVRVINLSNKDIDVKLEDQIRLVLANAEKFIDLD